MENIIFYNSNQVWGGGEKWHFNMALALSSRGHTCRLITNPKSDLQIKAQRNSLSTLELKTSNLSFLNPFKLIRLYLNLQKIKPDVIFLNLPSDVKICAPIAKLAGVSKVIYRRGMPNPIRNTVLNKYFYSKVDIIIANSFEIKKSIIQNIPDLDKKVSVIFNGVSPRKNEHTPMNTPIRLGNLGRLVEQKGQYHLIEVAKILKQKDVNFKMKIAGKGPLETKLKELILKNSLSNSVELVGHTSAAEFFKSIDIFLFTSHFEGSANALIESLQAAVPAIAFDMSSMPEVLENNKTGYLVPAKDEQAMALKVIELIKSPSNYNLFQRNCEEVIREHFDYSKKIDEVEKLLNKENIK